jgi:hypothetical protein
VASVELRDGFGRASSVFRSGAPLNVFLGLRAADAVQRSELVLELRSQEGARVFRTTTVIEFGADRQAQVAFEIPDLALLGGDYDLLLGAPSPDRTVRFSVASEPGPEGVVDLRGSWRALSVEGVR